MFSWRRILLLGLLLLLCVVPAHAQVTQIPNGTGGGGSSVGGSQATDPQTATAYTIPSSDNGALIRGVPTAAATYTLAQAGSTNFTCDANTPANCFNVTVANHSAFAIVVGTTSSTWDVIQGGVRCTAASCNGSGSYGALINASSQLVVNSGYSAYISVGSATAPGVWDVIVAPSPGTGGGGGVTTFHVDLTAQTANVALTTLTTPAAAGYYRVGCIVLLTTAATTSSTLPSCKVSWTDELGTVHGDNVTTTSTANTVGTMQRTNPLIEMYVKAGTAIQYSTVNYATSGATSMAYSLHFAMIGPF